MASTIITNAGVAAAALAQTNGIKVQIGSFSIGSTITTPLATMTDVPSKVYTASVSASNFSYSILSSNVVNFKVILTDAVGPFTIGSIGLYLIDGTLFSISALDAIETKTATTSPARLGNRRSYNIPIQITNVLGAINISLLSVSDLTIPQLPNLTALPDPSISGLNEYIIQNDINFARPSIAFKANSVWYYIPAFIGGALAELPVSLFPNDVGYITSASVPPFPTLISAFTNNVGYITSASVPTLISAFTNNVGYITSASVPTYVSSLINDSGYITAATANYYVPVTALTLAPYLFNYNNNFLINITVSAATIGFGFNGNVGNWRIIQTLSWQGNDGIVHHGYPSNPAACVSIIAYFIRVS